MTTDPKYICIDEYKHSYCYDTDDFDRNRALLLWFPEWKQRLTEMSIISEQWENLVINWNEIERLYDIDYEEYGNKAFGKGQCDKYIRHLLTKSS
jgi:hypothetical protein